MKLHLRRNSIIIILCILSFTLGGFITQKLEEEKITAILVKQAQKIIGLEFTDAEADSMLQDLERRRKGYVALRKLNISNSTAPVLNFNPLPVGYRFPDQSNYFKVSNQEQIKLPSDREQMAFFTITQLAALIQSKQISSVELTRFFIDRLKKYDSSLLYAVSITEERAMKQAKKADAEIAAGKYR
jgi:hypothetical protein